MLEARDLVALRDGRRVLDGVSISAAPGELVGVIGPNGAGKSSLLRLLCGLDDPAGGTVTLDGRRLGALHPADRAQRIAYLPQGGAIEGAVTVAETVALARLAHPGEARTHEAAAVGRALDRLDIRPLAGRIATRLSGGEKSRVLLARALAVEAPVLIVDEPTLALDPYHQLQALAALADEAAAGRTVIVVLHDWPLAARFCTRLVLMAAGRIVADDAPGAVLASDRLGAVYRVAVARFERDGVGIALPWSRLD